VRRFVAGESQAVAAFRIDVQFEGHSHTDRSLGISSSIGSPGCGAFRPSRDRFYPIGRRSASAGTPRSRLALSRFLAIAGAGGHYSTRLRRR
jgi:hypothetical protein